jgi:hypothetical protein
MRRTFYYAYLVLAMISSSAFMNPMHLEPARQLHKHTKTQTLGIAIVLYRVGKSENIDDLAHLEKQMDKSKSVNLYKATQDLGIIFMNTTDAFSNTSALPYKMLFGSYVEKEVGDHVINGFVSTTEVAAIFDWIKKNNINTFNGFEKMYDGLSKEAKQQLEDIGADDKKALFQAYAQPLTRFYFAAQKENNSVVISGE